MTCQVPGCDAEGHAHLQATLCMSHVVTVNRALDRAGLTHPEEWDKRCAEVKRWVEAKRRKTA